MRAPNTRDLIEAWADRYCTEHTDHDHANGCPAEEAALTWLNERDRNTAWQAWEQGARAAAMSLDHGGHNATNPHTKETK